VTTNTISRSRPFLGTYVNVEVRSSLSDDKLIKISQKIYNRISQLEKMLSFHEEESELSYINTNAYHHDCSISDEMHEVIKQALQISKITNGLYDISIGGELMKRNFLPKKYHKSNNNSNWQDIILKKNKIKFKKKLQIDLGGIAKGYIVDQALLEVQNEKANIIINAGGDVIMNNWSNEFVNVRVPSNINKKFKRLLMKNKAVATSSSYYFNSNKNPIIIPSSKKMLKDKRSASVFAASCMIADALTKVVFLCKNSVEILKNFGAQAVIIDEKGKFSNQA
jgi:thiamine biosynthesis lipoprotein